MKRILAIVGCLLFGTLATADASPVDVTCTVSGSAGNWLLDISVTDNLGGTNNLYLFGVLSSPRNISASPVGWDPNAVSSYNPVSYGGSSTNYDNLWITGPTGASTIIPGQTLSAFQVRSTAAAKPTEVKWMAVAYGGTYTGPGCSFICGAPYDNPGFEGVSTTATLSVGDPLSLGIEFALAGSSLLRGGAEFRYAIPQAGHVTITVHDLAGRVVATLVDDQVTAGRHSATWQREGSATAGVYFARMRVAGAALVQRVVILK